MNYSKSLREGNLQKRGDKDRVKKGNSGNRGHVGWVEKPTYDATTHR